MDFNPALRPCGVTLTGRLIIVEPLNLEAHGSLLWARLSGSKNDELWRYLPEGPFSDRSSFDAYLTRKIQSKDAVCYALIDERVGGAVGIASLMRIDQPNQVVEVGAIHYSKLLQQTAGATEAMYLLARYAFDGLGYRRYEWKCNALNLPSRRAAERLGFTFEGIFRQHMIVKGANRDTAWYSMLDSEWSTRKRRFEAWLRPENFNSDGKQLRSLSEID